MTITNEKVLYFEINRDPTNVESFFRFTEKLNNIIKKENIYPCILIMDDL